VNPQRALAASINESPLDKCAGRVESGAKTRRQHDFTAIRHVAPGPDGISPDHAVEDTAAFFVGRLTEHRDDCAFPVTAMQRTDTIQGYSVAVEILNGHDRDICCKCTTLHEDRQNGSDVKRATSALRNDASAARPRWFGTVRRDSLLIGTVATPCYQVNDE
jgi:hypothetical protein